MFDIVVSMITANSVEATSANTTLTVFSAAGSGLSVSTITEGSTQMTGLFHQVFETKVPVTLSLP